MQSHIVQWNVDNPTQLLLQWDEFCNNIYKNVEELNDIDDELAKTRKEFVALLLNDRGHIIYNEGIVITILIGFAMKEFLQLYANKGL